MEDLVSIARRLREVRRACRHFLDQWMIERINACPSGFDRLTHDLTHMVAPAQWGHRHLLDD